MPLLDHFHPPLSEELCLPLALEEPYRATCAALRIPDLSV
jgi:hypothetical protein